MKQIVMLLALLLTVPAHVSADDEATLVQIHTRDGKSHVGELISTNSTETKLFDIELESEITVAKQDISKMANPFGEIAAARALGLPAFFAWKIRQLPARQSAVGKVAKLSQATIYFTLNKDQVKVGQQLDVYRHEGEIIDPDTGKILAVERPRIARIEVTEVANAFSKGKLVGELETVLQVGDEVERPGNGERRIAVCPIPLQNGQLSNLGLEMSEDLTTRLVNSGTKVVERSALDEVLTELVAQNTIFFEPKEAQRIGEMTGATHVVVGKIVQKRKLGTAYVRLVDVTSGEIRVAVSASISLANAQILSDATGRMSKSTSGSSSTKIAVSTTDNEFDYLAKSRALPKYLTTASSLEKTAKGVRFLGFPKHYDFEAGIIKTRIRDFIDRNFVFEVLVTFGPDDGVTHIGIGSGRQDGSANRRAESVFVRFHSPHHGDGGVSQLGWQKPEVTFGHVREPGVHLLRMTKEGNTLVFEVDPEHDGPTADDFETVIPDLSAYAPYLHAKNSVLFIGGTGTIVATRLTVKP